MDHCSLRSSDIPLGLNPISREMQCLLAALRNDAIDDVESINWDQLLVLVESHGVLPVFCKSYSGELPENFMDSLRRHWATSALFANELHCLLDLFARNGIEALPLKGPVLAESLYESVSLRAFDDLDLLVRSADFASAQSLLIESGFDPVDDAGNYHRAFVGRGTFVELHFAVDSPSLPQFDIEGAWARSKAIYFRGHSTRIFDKPDLLLYLALHGVKHHFARLTWLLDIACVLGDLDDKDVSPLLEMARTIGAEGALLTSCHLAHLVFGVELLHRLREAIILIPTVSVQAQLLAESILSGPAKVGTPTQNAAIFVNLEVGYRRRWANRLRFLIPTQQDKLWAKRYGIPAGWVRYLRPFRLLFRHGPTLALQTMFPGLIRRAGTTGRGM